VVAKTATLHTMASIPSTQNPQSFAPVTRVPGRRWRIGWLLGLGVLVNYLDRVNLTVSQDSLHTAFGISFATFGVLAAAYNYTYALCQLPIGVILDRFGIRRVGRVSIFIWSIASFAAAAATSVSWLFGARLLLGVGESPIFPSSAKAVGRWFPPQERSLATSIFDSAAKFSSALGVPILGLLLVWMGWRWSFAATGIISLLYLLIFNAVYRDPADDPGLSAIELAHINAAKHAEALQQAVTPDGPSLPLLTLMRQRKVIGMVLGFGGYNYTFYMLLTWLPTYLAMTLHIDLKHSFLYTGVPWLVGTLADLLIGGLLADGLIQRGWDASRVRKFILVGGTACGLGILGATTAHTATAALLWISLSIGGLSAASAIGWSVPSLIAPRSSVGSVGGIINFSNQASGIAAAIVTGYLVERLHSFAWAFGVATIYLAIGVISYILLLGKIEPMPLEVAS
jgi:ACS family D-galactonate transporter-like MFS transporter